MPRSHKSIIRAIPLLAIVMRLSSETADLSYLVLAGYAFFGPEEILHSLALTWLFTMLSEGVATLPDQLAVGRYPVFAASALTLWLRSGMSREWFSMSQPMAATLALGVFLFVHSVVFSVLPVVSILKALLWTVVMMTVLSAWFGLGSEARERVERQLFVGLLVLLLASLPFAFTETGYLRNNSGFQGVLNHPQAFGPVAVVVAAWLGGRLLSSDHYRPRDVALLLMCIVLAALSESRTAGYALVLGLASTVLFSPLLTKIPARHLMPGLSSRWLHALGLVAAIGLVVAKPVLSGRLQDYIEKRTDLAGLIESPILSRGPLIETMMSNFSERPLTGIGFGIASDLSSTDVVLHPILGLPLSASVEKGVLPIGVLEELGIFGFSLVVMWLWTMIKHVTRAGVTPFAVVSVVLLTNLGESTLFSPGGLGLLLLILLSWAVARADSRNLYRDHG